MTDPKYLDEAFELVEKQLLEIFKKKHKDYGKENILEIEELGIVFRLQEKVSRLKNLLMKGGTPQNESIEDNIRDIAVYAIIIELFRKGWFQKLEMKS